MSPGRGPSVERPLPTLLFDVDGSLLESEAVAQLAYARGFTVALGRDITPEEAAYLVGKPGRLILDQWFPGRDVMGAVLREYAALQGTIRPYPGVAEMLGELRRLGHRLGAVSSKLRDPLHSELDRTGLARFLSVVIGQEDSPRNKPAPDPLLMAAERLGVEPRCAVYLGDQPVDIEAAEAAGMTSVGLLWGHEDVRLLEGVSPTFVCRTPQDVVTLARSGFGTVESEQGRA